MKEPLSSPVIECKDSVIIVNGYLVFINTVSIIVCVYLCFKIHTYLSLRGNHAFERREEKKL